MADFMKSLLGRLTGKAANGAAASLPPVSVGVCGKHPCEEDHFSHYDSGAVRMPELLRLLYTEGIKANIESGAWQQLGGKRLAAFDHVFVSCDPTGVIAGKMWPSRDRVGRSDYPIIFAAECRGMSPARVIDQVLPELQHLYERSKEAHSQAIIAAEVSAAQ